MKHVRSLPLLLATLTLGCNPAASTLRQPAETLSVAPMRWNVDSAAAAAPSCGATADSARTPADARLGPGEYLLIVVGTEGQWAGRSVGGRLWLAPTSGSDRSPRTGRGPADAGDTIRTPLYGATDVPLDSVGAPIFVDDTIAPPPTSADPVRPGVLVLRSGWQSPETAAPQYVLTVGTLSNLRDEPYWLDGAGIGMRVRHVTERDFRGTWGSWGIVRGGGGYFCATKVGN